MSRCPWSASAPPGAPVCDHFTPRSVTPPPSGRGIMAAPAQPVGRCLGLAMPRKHRPRPSGGGTMADSFGPMRAGGTGDGVVASGLGGGPSREEPIRVLVVDDHALFRRGLEIVLAAEEDIQVVG